MRTHKILSPADRTRLAAAIAELEWRSSAELVVVVAHRSASYAAYGGLLAAAIALLAGWSAAFIEPDLPAAHFALLQGLLLLGGGALCWLTPIGVVIVPTAVKRARATALARLEFADLVNNRTRRKDGVLLFLSVAEHYIEIVADDAVAAVIPEERWRRMIGQFTAKAKGAPVGECLNGLVRDCAALLAEHFPPRPGQANELTDQVKEI